MLGLRSQDGVQADGVATIAVQASLVDSQGVAAQGKNLVFALPSGVDATFTDASKALVLGTDAHGQAVAKVRARSASDVIVNVTCKLQDQDEPKANLDVHFKADVPIEQYTRLTLETTKNHATFGTGQQDEVLATLTDMKGAPGKNISLIFTLPQSSRAIFINGTKSITVTTDEKGQVRVAVIAAKDGAFTTTVTCIVELNATVNANTDVVFETSIVTPALTLEVTKNNAKVIDGDYIAVRAKIKLPTNSPQQHYVLGVTLKNTPDHQEYLIFAANSSSDNASFAFLNTISTTGDETNIDVWIKYKNTNITSNVSAVIVAELFYPKGSARENDNPVVSNEVTVTFLVQKNLSQCQ
ncbi:Ig-like domain-containing protein [Paenochrobactrum glaciei]|uniref:Big-1 domain-containing protein n=1 Tax=Paenochrobactrum glaciei TaxID=486407 RepID=A0ABP3RDS3_9HYPH